MTVLLCAEQVARAADLHIAHGDLEARAELGKLAHRLQPFGRDVAQHLAAHESEIRERAAGGTPHPSAQLVKLRQPEAVGVFDDQRVDVGDIHTGFDDGGAHQNINVVLQHLPPNVR